MNNFKVGDTVIDVDEGCAPRKVVMYYCQHCKKKIVGLCGTTDKVTIPLTEYNERLYYKIN